MNEDSPNGSPYETLATYDQSETKRDSGVLVLGVGGCDNLEDREVTACVALSRSCDTSAVSESGSVA
jgi:hypothetical protein